MDDISIVVLLVVLFVLILLSAFFSGTETALMTLNRYRLNHLANEGHRGAHLAQELLKRPDRLLGIILLFNNLVNNAAAALVGAIAFKLYGDVAVAVATFLLTLVVLIFAEVTPKTLAALRPERLALPAAYFYTLLMKPYLPFVWLVYMINTIANSLLAIIGVRISDDRKDKLNADELRVVVNEAKQFISGEHTDMLLRVLDLEKASVEDIMIPRNDITGIDLHDDWNDIERQITHSQRTRVPVFQDNIDNTVGMLHLRNLLNLFAKDELNIDNLKSQIRKAYFIPEGTSLTQQLINFQKNKRRSGLVVDEYGSIQGLVTLEDILEEIVGQFTTDSQTRSFGIHNQKDGSYLVDGSTHIRDINRSLSLELPTNGPKTLNGLILEHMEMIPEPGTSLMIDGYPIEVIRTSNNAVHSARLTAPVTQEDKEISEQTDSEIDIEPKNETIEEEQQSSGKI